MQKCYFCESESTRTSSSQRTIQYDNQTYRFARCQECRGFSLYPKLTDLQLSSLYSSDYVADENSEIPSQDQKYEAKFAPLDNYLGGLRGAEGKTFLDFGCGANPISFTFAKKCELVPIGMELSQDVREMAQKNARVQMFSREEIMDGDSRFDFVFLGDVLEHLIEPTAELRALKAVMSDQGVLIAQGPLQGERTLTHIAVRMFAWLTQRKTTSYPPYHVSLATTRSMRELFIKSGFQVNDLKTYEVDWPAPTFRELWKNLSLRGLLLFSTKQVDKMITHMCSTSGTRYFAVCTKSNDTLSNK